MKLTKAKLLKKPVVVCGFGEDINSVYAEFQEYKGRNKILAIIPKKYKILYADYTYEDCYGDAYVFGFDKEQNKFFEIHGKHCSCYGLEGQWEPEYFYDIRHLQVLCDKRFSSRSEKYRQAESSVEFENWLYGLITNAQN